MINYISQPDLTYNLKRDSLSQIDKKQNFSRKDLVGVELTLIAWNNWRLFVKLTTHQSKWLVFPIDILT